MKRSILLLIFISIPVFSYSFTERDRSYLIVKAGAGSEFGGWGIATDFRYNRFGVSAGVGSFQFKTPLGFAGTAKYHIGFSQKQRQSVWIGIGCGRRLYQEWYYSTDPSIVYKDNIYSIHSLIGYSFLSKKGIYADIALGAGRLLERPENFPSDENLIVLEVSLSLGYAFDLLL